MFVWIPLIWKLKCAISHVWSDECSLKIWIPQRLVPTWIESMSLWFNWNESIDSHWWLKTDDFVASKNVPEAQCRCPYQVKLCKIKFWWAQLIVDEFKSCKNLAAQSNLIRSNHSNVIVYHVIGLQQLQIESLRNESYIFMDILMIEKKFHSFRSKVFVQNFFIIVSRWAGLNSQSLFDQRLTALNTSCFPSTSRWYLRRWSRRWSRIDRGCHEANLGINQCLNVR